MLLLKRGEFTERSRRNETESEFFFACKRSCVHWGNVPYTCSTIVVFFYNLVHSFMFVNFTQVTMK